MHEFHFAETFRTLAQARGLSIEYLADFTRLDASFIRRLMTGEKKPSHATVILLAMALVSCPDKYARDKVGLPNTLSTLIAALLSDAAVSSTTGNGRRAR